ncbi:hypothetical protein J1605_014245 [Eschrichtius robustus]|uniref:Uncharacterized protein n=1 Tax=Eschrichtius robustus TaxID=9764 RepID=A0AB34GET0_ESCRO|nr:hypothetical protein J1605_014245 [Eschrichtius robustus]
MFQSAGRSSEEGATREGCKDTGSGLFPVDTAETPLSLHIPTRGSPTQCGVTREQRPGKIRLSSQLCPLGPPDTPASGRGGEGRESFLVRKQGKEEAVAQSGPGVRLGEQRGRESTSSPDSANPLKSAAGAEPQCLWIRRFLKASPAYRITNAISQHPGLYTVNKRRGCSGPGKFENNRFTSAIHLNLLQLTIADCQGRRQLGNASTELGPSLWSHPIAQRGLVAGSNSGADWAAAESLKETVSSGAPEC